MWSPLKRIYFIGELQGSVPPLLTTDGYNFPNTDLNQDRVRAVRNRLGLIKRDGLRGS